MITTQLFGQELYFETDNTVFSPSGIDSGTKAMLGTLTLEPGSKVLDLGCGYGVVGISIARCIGEEHVILCDISETAVALSKENALRNGLTSLDIRISNGFSAIPEDGFTLILSNPPYHTDFSVAKHFIEIGYKRLVPGGQMVMVTKRLDWYKNKLTAVFGGVRVAEIDGYYVFTAEKRAKKSAAPKKKQPTLSKKLARKYAR